MEVEDKELFTYEEEVISDLLVLTPRSSIAQFIFNQEFLVDEGRLPLY